MSELGIYNLPQAELVDAMSRHTLRAISAVRVLIKADVFGKAYTYER